jgi:glycine/D-amino acid oxidase-like deaminating enzyme
MTESAEVVICGAGIGGIATAYFLSVHHGVRDVVLVDARPPLSLTSDKSTECYRNWWPGPGDAMVQMMNRSIDLMEEMAAASSNAFHLNRRGYLYTTTKQERIADLEGFAQEASSLEAGEVRTHPPGAGSSYQPHKAEGYQDAPGGADLITDRALIAAHFPYLSSEIAGVLHVRRAGWLSAQQYGITMLDAAKEAGVSLVEDRVVGVETAGGRIDRAQLESGKVIRTPVFVNAAGPLLAEVGAMLGEYLPVFHELHMKASIEDAQGVVGRDAPLLIDIDPQYLEWSEEERAWLQEDEDNSWQLDLLPSGAHTRPEGSRDAESILMLWDLDTRKVPPALPAPTDPFYPELAIRGLCRMLPGMQAYVTRIPKPFIDSGYYTKTEENRPLASPTATAGGFVIGAMSGFGIMAAAALGELTARHVTGAALPTYAGAFTLARYDDPGYQEQLASWGDSWQL